MTDTPITPTPLPRWKVTSQQEGVAPGPSGTYTKGVTVYFTLEDGTPGSVFVPNTTFNPDFVKAAIADRAQTLANIGALSSD